MKPSRRGVTTDRKQSVNRMLPMDNSLYNRVAGIDHSYFQWRSECEKLKTSH